MNVAYRNYVTLALVTTLLVLVHLLIEHGPCRRWTLTAITVPWAVNPATTFLPQPFTKPVKNVVKRNSIKTVKHSAVRYRGHINTHSEKCPQLGSKVLVAVIVASAPGNFAARQAIRITWGSLLIKLNFPLIFILGRHDDENATSMEDREFGDLVMGNFEDSYNNLSLKTLSILEWMSKFCPRAHFLLKIDDDVFLNTSLLLEFAAARINATQTIWGYLNRISFPYRSMKKKYYVPIEEYPGRKFPPFVSGPGYLMSGDCIVPIMEMADKVRFVRMEDVLVSGVAAAQVGVKRRHSSRFKIGSHALAPPCQLRQLILLHEVRPRDHVELWWRLHDPDVKCDTSKFFDAYVDE